MHSNKNINKRASNRSTHSLTHSHHSVSQSVIQCILFASCFAQKGRINRNGNNIILIEKQKGHLILLKRYFKHKYLISSDAFCRFFLSTFVDAYGLTSIRLVFFSPAPFLSISLSLSFLLLYIA